jgi:hypothetical protein
MMTALRKAGRKNASLSVSQRRRPRPSRIKPAAVSPSTAAGRLGLALELSDLCLALRDAARRKR